MTEEDQSSAADEQENISENSPETASETDAGPADGTGDTSGEAPRADLPDYKLLAAELNDKMLRAVAELENYRRRADKERQDTAKFAITGFARDCLPVLDNLRRGLDSVSKEDRDGNPAMEALAAGMELTERELIAALERHGIEKIDPKGAPFDYNRHQAMFEIDDKSQPAGVVVEVVQPGYMLKGRLLRPAMVGVAKGGPKPAPIQAPIANEDLAAAPDAAAPDATGPGQVGQEQAAPPGADAGENDSGSGAGSGTSDGQVDTKV